jgi:hypothetical protein
VISPYCACATAGPTSIDDPKQATMAVRTPRPRQLGTR